MCPPLAPLSSVAKVAPKRFGPWGGRIPCVHCLCITKVIQIEGSLPGGGGRSSLGNRAVGGNNIFPNPKSGGGGGGAGALRTGTHQFPHPPPPPKITTAGRMGEWVIRARRGTPQNTHHQEHRGGPPRRVARGGGQVVIRRRGARPNIQGYQLGRYNDLLAGAAKAADKKAAITGFFIGFSQARGLGGRLVLFSQRIERRCTHIQRRHSHAIWWYGQTVSRPRCQWGTLPLLSTPLPGASRDRET